jgi:hypothetical protein
MAYGYLLSATYESGYEHVESDQDVSPYAPGRNHFFDILHAEPTKAGHGRMTKFSLIRVTPDADGSFKRWDVDWVGLPEDAQPIHYMNMQRSIALTGAEDGDSGPYCVSRGFGFTYKDPESGEQVTHVEEIDNVTGLPVVEAPAPQAPPLVPGDPAIQVGSEEELPVPETPVSHPEQPAS